MVETDNCWSYEDEYTEGGEGGENGESVEPKTPAIGPTTI